MSGPSALDRVRKATRGKSRASMRNGARRGRGADGATVEHVIAMDARPANVFVKALGNWIGRVTQSSIRRAG